MKYEEWLDWRGKNSPNKHFGLSAKDAFEAGQANPPEGWKFVPLTITPEMRCLLLRADEFTIDEMYIMLLAAAPTPGKDKE